MTPHEHDHGHSHQTPNFGRAFAVGIALNGLFVLVEASFGFFANSLALLTDAGHNLGDVMGLLVAWGATYLSQWQPTQRFTFGFRKSSVLAALLNALFLLVSIGAISWEAVGRLREPAPIHSATMIVVASIGIVINTATALLFMRGRGSDLNIRSAFLHMLADAAVSAGVVVAGVVITWTGLSVIDPIVSLAIAAIILVGTWSLLRDSVSLAMDAVPTHIDADAVRAYLQSLPEVKDVHHVHIWGLSTSDAAMTAHVVLSQPDLNNALLALIREELHEHFQIGHATIQLEAHEGDTCLVKQCRLDCGHERHA
jgi:cobalt-zinc-cadmium efflux system protein